MRLLIIEDNDDDIRIVHRMLASVSANTLELVSVDRLSTALARLQVGHFDVALVDLQLPDSQGLETLTRIQAQSPHLPTIVLTGWDDAQLGLEAVQAGAQDYLVKGEVSGALLVRCIRYAMERKQGELRARQALEAEALDLTQANHKLRELDHRKSEFLATISHESRSQLHSIIGFAGTLLQGLSGPLTDGQREQLVIIKNAAQHLLDLNSDFLDLSAVETGLISLVIEPFSLEDVVREVVERFAPQTADKNVALVVASSTPAMTIASDRKRVVQILTNLVDNAVKFTREGEIRIAWRVHASQLEVSVADTGIGIPEADIPWIFETFRQSGRPRYRHQGGMGLGLYLCKKLITLLGGNIWAESIDGQGSRFTFTLPCQPHLPA